jgi:hypothetical protein
MAGIGAAAVLYARPTAAAGGKLGLAAILVSPGLVVAAGARLGVSPGGLTAVGRPAVSAGVLAGVSEDGGVTDRFSDAAGVSLTSHTPDAGGSWAVVSGTPGVVAAGHRARAGGVTASSVLHYHSAVPASADYEVSADVVQLSGTTDQVVGVLGRVDAGTDSCYILRYSQPAGQIQFLKRTSGVFSSILGSSSYTPTTGVPFRLALAMTGASMVGRLNGSTVITHTDASITAAGRAGIALLAQSVAPSDATGLHIDDFRGVGLVPGVVLYARPSAAAGLKGGVSSILVSAGLVVAAGARLGVAPGGLAAIGRPAASAGVLAGAAGASLVAYARPVTAAGARPGACSVLVVAGGGPLRPGTILAVAFALDVFANIGPSVAFALDVFAAVHLAVEDGAAETPDPGPPPTPPGPSFTPIGLL